MDLISKQFSFSYSTDLRRLFSNQSKSLLLILFDYIHIIVGIYLIKVGFSQKKSYLSSLYSRIQDFQKIQVDFRYLLTEISHSTGLVCGLIQL